MTTVEIHTTLNACNKTLRSVYPNIRIKTECAEDKNQNVFIAFYILLTELMFFETLSPAWYFYEWCKVV